MATAFFFASKLLAIGLQVETWILGLAVLVFWALRTDRLRLAKRVAGTLVAAMVTIGVFPLGGSLLRSIEETYPVIHDLQTVDGLIVLGGGEAPQASMVWEQPQLNDAGDRYVATLALAHQHPNARILFAGGSGRLRDVAGAPVSEASIAAKIFSDQGIAAERLLMEDRSRNTAENARLSMALADPAPDETWVLITSAYHMPRAMRSFEAAGWRGLVAYPVDFRSSTWRDGMKWDFTGHAKLLNIALKERAGALVYKVLGQ